MLKRFKQMQEWFLITKGRKNCKGQTDFGWKWFCLIRRIPFGSSQPDRCALSWWIICHVAETSCNACYIACSLSNNKYSALPCFKFLLSSFLWFAGMLWSSCARKIASNSARNRNKSTCCEGWMVCRWSKPAGYCYSWFFPSKSYFLKK